jgi:hypothetical protein
MSSVRGVDVVVRWHFFIGSCILTGALLLPHAPLHDILIGIGLAVLLTIPLSQK